MNGRPANWWVILLFGLLANCGFPSPGQGQDKPEDVVQAFKDLAAEVRKLTEEVKSARGAKVGSEDSPPQVEPPAENVTVNPAEIDAGTADLAIAGTDYPFRVSTGARKLHVIHFANTNDDTIGRGAAANVGFLRTVFNKQTENCRDRLNMKEITGSNFTVRQVDANLRQLSDVTTFDTLVVYFSTHGGFNANLNDHFFQTQPETTGATKGFYSRRRVLQQLQGKARLLVVMSDACTTPFSPPQGVVTAPALSQTTNNALFDLLFFYQGTVNISSSTPPNPSYYYNNASVTGGGIYTRALSYSSVYAPVSSETAGQRLGWENFFKDLQTRGTYNDAQGRGNQRPVWFSAP